MLVFQNPIMSKEIRDHFDKIAPDREKWEHRSSYYYLELRSFFRKHVPEGKSVLEIGCGRASLLKALKPKLGVGIDLSYNMLRQARRNFPQGTFICMDAFKTGIKMKFDFIILSDVIGILDDIQGTLEEVSTLCHEDTRIIITYYNYIYEYPFRAAEKLRLKMPQPRQSWISYDDVNSFLTLAGITTVRRGRMYLCPFRIPLIAPLLNKYVSALPLINHLNLIQYWIGKQNPAFKREGPEYSVSVIVPARNEAGNIEEIVKRTPDMGKHTEIIFVEGGSSDDTEAQIKRVMEKYRDKDISFYKQDGTGKANADYKGMDNANGDILMILDADMTVPPEELPKFYHAMKNSNADLVMGSRLVYPMEQRAMRFLNFLGNKSFGVLLSWIIGQRIKDTLCGTKVLFRKKYLEIKQQSSDLIKLDPFGDFFFILGTARNMGKILEIPIRYRERTYGSTNISRFKHGLYLLKMSIYGARKLKFK